MARTTTILIQLSLFTFSIVAATVPQDGSQNQPQQNPTLDSLRNQEEKAAKGVMAAAADARKRAHGDGSDRFANGLEESMLDLEEMKHEMEEKQKKRHAQLEKQKQAIHAHFQEVEKEIKLDTQERDREWKEEQKDIQARLAKLALQDTEMALQERQKKMMPAQKDKEVQAHPVHFLSATSRTPLMNDRLAEKEEQGHEAQVGHTGSEVPVEEMQIGMHLQSGSGSGLRLVLFLAAIVAVHLLWQGDARVVNLPALGMVKPRCWVKGLLTGEDRSTLTRLKPLNGSEYGGFTV